MGHAAAARRRVVRWFHMTRLNWQSPWHKTGATPRGVSNAQALRAPASAPAEMFDPEYEGLALVLARLDQEHFTAWSAVLSRQRQYNDAADDAVRHLLLDVQATRRGLDRPAPRQGPPTKIAHMTFLRWLREIPRDALENGLNIAQPLTATDRRVIGVAIGCEVELRRRTSQSDT